MAACILLSIVILSTSKSTQYASSLRSWLALRCVAVEQGGDLLNESVLHLIHNSLLEGTHLVFQGTLGIINVLADPKANVKSPGEEGAQCEEL